MTVLDAILARIEQIDDELRRYMHIRDYCARLERERWRLQARARELRGTAKVQDARMQG